MGALRADSGCVVGGALVPRAQRAVEGRQQRRFDLGRESWELNEEYK